MIVIDLSILFLNWFIDFVPNWLSILMMISGFFIMMIGYPVAFSGYSERDMRLSGLILIGAGVVILSIFLFQLVPAIVIITILVFTRWIEGAAAIRMLQKLSLFIFIDRNVGSPLTKPVRSFLLLYFVAFTAGWIGIAILIYSPILEILGYELAVIWTIMTILVSIFGLGWKFWSVRDKLPFRLVAGFILAATGAEISNFKLLGERLQADFAYLGSGTIGIDPVIVEIFGINVTVLIIGSITYSLGYWSAVGTWARTIRDKKAYQQNTGNSLPPSGRYLEDARDLSALELRNSSIEFLRDGKPGGRSWSELPPGEYPSQLTATAWEVLSAPTDYPEDVLLEAHKVSTKNLENIDPPPPIHRRGLRASTYELFQLGYSIEELREWGTPKWALLPVKVIHEKSIPNAYYQPSEADSSLDNPLYELYLEDPSEVGPELFREYYGRDPSWLEKLLITSKIAPNQYSGFPWGSDRRVAAFEVFNSIMGRQPGPEEAKYIIETAEEAIDKYSDDSSIVSHLEENFREYAQENT